MANLFLKVDKDLFNKNLNPTEILIIAQVSEFIRNGKECFMTNKQFAENFGVSESTIKRTFDKLEKEGYLYRETKASQKGKDRKIFLGSKVQNEPCENSNENSAKAKMNLAEGSNCTLCKEQNEPIKDNNIKDNLKDNNSGVSQTTFERTPLEPKVEEVKIDGEITAFDLEWNAPTYKIIDKEKNLIQFPTGKVFKVV